MDASGYRGREHSRLYLIRVWAEEAEDTGNSASGGHGNSQAGPGADGASGAGNGQRIEWCGKLQDVVSGEAQPFRGWPTLIELLLDMTRTGAPGGTDRPPPASSAGEAL